MAMRRMKPNRHKGPWSLGGMRSFMMFWMPRNQGARKGEHPLQRSTTLK
jgi:hypothetical protein